ncbi:site-specific integrase [Devosia sp. Root105]|uniref:tyrosine-type recombinase/integrase n=1 Tax=Devosia sp. Root105 TaxID=1736423 RepID=UPI0006F54074|nr:site-specific integrase [Devosia sp. Root105]KQU95210.1 integrase [Devosia sp. Root105]
MSVRKREWTNAKGEAKEAWVVDYVDGSGTRRLKTFKRKKDADNFAASAHVEVREGVHVADSASVTVREAGKLWLAGARAAGLERTTVAQYEQHLKFHILDHLGDKKLTALNAPAVSAFRDTLRDEVLVPKGRRKAKRSPAMIRKVMSSLGSLLADAQERGLVGRNAVRDMRGARKQGKDRRLEKRQKGKLVVGVDIPLPHEVKAMVGKLDGTWRPLLLIAIFTGLRASELRGLKWEDVDFEKRVIHVRQRADRFNDIGRPKSATSERGVPMPPLVLNTLREWKLACPKKATGKADAHGNPVKVLDLVFPNGNGNVESHANIINRGLHPVQVAAGVTVDSGQVEEDGTPVMVAKYTGLHSLRHFYASWCINRREDGGLGLPPKSVQDRLGHSSIVMTMDTYGHLFPNGNDDTGLAEAEMALLG